MNNIHSMDPREGAFKPIFIVGVGRSGTSLLQSMLNSHSSIAFPPETHFFRHYVVPKVPWTKAADLIPKDRYLLNMELDLPKLISESSGLIDFYVRCMREYGKARNKLYVGDKDPKNIENIRTICRYFPGALIVHMYRDPRGVIASRLRAEWSKDSPLWQHILAYKGQYNYMVKNSGLFPEGYVPVKYEDLLTHPRQVLQTVLSPLQLDFEPEMLEFFRHSDEVVKGEEKSWKENLYNPVMKENIDKWSTQLEVGQIRAIESALYPEMRGCGYSFSYKNWAKSCMYRLAACIYCTVKCK